MTRPRILALLSFVALVVAGAIGWQLSWQAAPRTQSPVVARVPADATPPNPAPMINLPVTAQDAKVINARQPFRPDLIRAARPWSANGSGEDRARGRDCLAAAMWYEAGDDPSGARAVAQVVLNRARHPAFAASICAVVFQGMERATGCQFTFTCDGSMQRRVPAAPAWQRARKLADAALTGAVDRRVGLATHYHTDWVVPIWSGQLDKLGAVGTHLFFQWPGYWGSSRVFRRAVSGVEPRIDRLAMLSPAHAPPGEASGSVATADDVPATTHGVRFAAPAQQQGDRFFVHLQAERAIGEQSVAAVNQCSGRQRCLVLGWLDDRLVARRLPLGTAQANGLALIYRREGDRETLLWDCDRFPRLAGDHCLPAPNARAALLR